MSKTGLSIAQDGLDSEQPLHRFTHMAMACDFEIYVAGEEREYARQACAAAFSEVDDIEKEISRFIDYSDVSRINNSAPGQPVRIGYHCFECLQLAAEVSAQTNGAFDVTIGALLGTWRRSSGQVGPTDEDLAKARKSTGISLLEIDPEAHTVTRRAGGVKTDLGGIGKGYAVDRIVELLRDWSIAGAVVHGGQSSAFALGTPPGAERWPITVRDPEDEAGSLGCVELKDFAVSGSGVAVHGRHIIDPRSGRPVAGRLGAWAAAESTVLSDALSTAFMVMSVEEVEQYCRQHPRVSAMILLYGDGGRSKRRFRLKGPAFKDLDRSEK